MAEINKEFIVNLQGKEFITYPGLMDLAHQMKLQSIATELIQIPSSENNNQCIFKAVATTEDGKVFEGYGDADPSNVNRMIAKHLIRMAETRAKARALRDLTNVGMTAFEELAGMEDITEKIESKSNKSNKGNSEKGISEAQERRLYAIAGGKGIDANTVKASIKQKLNKEVTALTKTEYDTICKAYEDMEVKK